MHDFQRYSPGLSRSGILKKKMQDFKGGMVTLVILSYQNKSSKNHPK